MSCKCGSSKIVSVSGKTSDMFFASSKGKNYEGYVPRGLQIGRGDYIQFKYCAECGQIQNFKPIKNLEKVLSGDE